VNKRQDRRKQGQRKQARRKAATGRAHAPAPAPSRVVAGAVSAELAVPPAIRRPPYAASAALQSAVAPGELVDRMRAACRAAREVLDETGAAVAPGVTTDHLDRVAHAGYLRRGGYPSTLRYRGYPKSICTSVNEVICHGIPDDRPLRAGDIVNVDVTIYLDGVHGDCSATFAVGEIDEESATLVAVTSEAMWRGIAQVRAGAPIHDIGRAIQAHAEAYGFGVVRTFVGHGIGTEFHTAPSIPHYYDPNANQPMIAGTTFTIEPMINAGGWQVGTIWPDGWTAPTRDGTRSAQFEHTVLVLPDGVDVLTAWPDEIERELAGNAATA
jgi:methionyl aminopeptidase